MISQGNIERTFSKRYLDNRLLYSLLFVVLSVLLFPLSSFATHSKVLLESADALGGNARFAYAATPVIQPSTGDTLYYNITYDDLHIIKDHLGSVRVALTTNGSIRERNDYYPFGLRTDQGRAYPTFSDRYIVKVPRLTQGANGTITQTGYRATAPYTLQYNGKELQLLANTTLIDYGARQYNPTLARWTAQDPMAEKYYGISPYAYCAGNPINMVDVNGEEGLVVSGSPGNHKNREHFLINGLNRALNIKGKTKNAEKVTWIVYNDKKNGYDRKTLDTYFAKAKKQGINTIEFSESKDIVDYVNIKEGNNSRDEDKISNFVYLGHSTIGTFEVGYEGSNQSFKAKDFNASAFEKSAEINLVGGCRTAVNRTFLGLTLSKSLVQQFSEILSKNATIYGSSTRVYYSGGVISDKKLLNKFGGSIIEKKGENDEEK